MLRTSPVISDSEKSTLAFHSCVKNASRSWRAEYFCKISCKVCDLSDVSCGYAFCAYINRDKILQRFAHLEALDVQMTRVKEIVHPCRAIMISLGVSCQVNTNVFARVPHEREPK